MVHHPSAAHRRGFSLIEALAATAVLTSLIAAWLPLQHVTAKLRRAGQWQQMAQFEAAGVMERLAAWPATELTAEKVAEIELSDEAQNVLPNANVQVDVQPATEDGLTRVRVAVRVTWKDSTADAKLHQIELVAWRHGTPQGDQP